MNATDIDNGAKSVRESVRLHLAVDIPLFGYDTDYSLLSGVTTFGRPSAKEICDLHKRLVASGYTDDGIKVWLSVHGYSYCGHPEEFHDGSGLKPICTLAGDYRVAAMLSGVYWDMESDDGDEAQDPPPSEIEYVLSDEEVMLLCTGDTEQLEEGIIDSVTDLYGWTIDCVHDIRYETKRIQ